jgi:hypothetical protein
MTLDSYPSHYINERQCRAQHKATPTYSRKNVEHKRQNGRGSKLGMLHMVGAGTHMMTLKVELLKYVVVVVS